MFSKVSEAFKRAIKSSSLRLKSLLDPAMHQGDNFTDTAWLEGNNYKKRRKAMAEEEMKKDFERLERKMKKTAIENYKYF